MALDKRQQAFLFERCREALGEEGATLLMNDVLPPNGWENVATKQDIERLDHRIDVLEHKLLAVFRAELAGAITAAITSQTRTLTFQIVGLFVAFATLTLIAR